VNNPNGEIKKKLNMSHFGYILHPHNFYIEWLIGAGILGLVGFSSIVILIFKELITINSTSLKPAIPFFAVAVFATTFWPLSHGMNYFTNRNAAIIWMTVGWALAITTATRKSLLPEPVSKKLPN
jgi:O-antigen ligase